MKLSLPQLPNGYEFYRGPSLIDGKEIVAIATLNSKNRKTGPSMIQTWILRADMNPLTAIAEKKDDSICGSCKHRGDFDGGRRTCYVNVGQAPNQIYKAWLNGKYPKDASAAWAKNRIIRLGSYGDPGVIPYEVWAKITKEARGWTGYTHLWKDCDRRFSNLVMASCDHRREYLEAKRLGYRTFRVRLGDQSLYKREFECPASAEQGFRLTCEECLACCGTHNGERKSAGDVGIVVHGRTGMHLAENLRLLKEQNEQ